MKFLIITLSILVFSQARAQNQPQSVEAPATSITGSIDVTRGAIRQLRTELELNVTRTKFSVADYREWNAKFCSQLDTEMYKLSERVEQEVADKLAPLANEYNQILSNASNLSSEQFESLKVMQMSRMVELAQSLTPTYANIYMDMVRNLIGWLPVVNIKNISDPSNHHTINRFASVIFALTIIGGGIELYDDVERGHHFFKETDYLGTRFDFEVFSLNKAKGSPKFSGTVSNGRSSIKVDDSQALYSAVDGTLQKSKHSLFDSYFVPAVKKDCRSQSCLALKESDLKLTLHKLANDIDQPFWIKFRDGKTVTINAPKFNVTAYEDYLSKPVTDPKMAFEAY